MMVNFPSTNPWYTITKIPLFVTNVIGYGNKVEQRIACNSGVRWSFKLRWKILVKADADAIRDFFIARKGAFESFDWLNPEDGITYKVRFFMDLINFDNFNYLLYEVQETEFIEVTA
jgi:hypothetical protein